MTNEIEVWEYPYISFDDAFEMAQKVKKMGGVVTPIALAKALDSKQSGWFGLKVASLRRWGLVEGRSDLRLTDYFQRIVSPRSPDDDLKAKKDLFFNIPLFNNLYNKYLEHGLPQEPYFSNVLQSGYSLKGRNPTLVSAIIRDFIEKNFLGYGSGEIAEQNNKGDVVSVVDNVCKTEVIIDTPEKDFIIIKTAFTEPFKWKITKSTDFKLIRSVIDSIEEEWNGKNIQGNSRGVLDTPPE